MTMRRLEIDRLNVQIGDVHPVRDVSLAIEPGQIFGIAGESGSGKSMTALAVMGLLPGGADRTGDGQRIRPGRCRRGPCPDGKFGPYRQDRSEGRRLADAPAPGAGANARKGG